jgi:hypothetical protein
MRVTYGLLFLAVGIALMLPPTTRFLRWLIEAQLRAAPYVDRTPLRAFYRPAAQRFVQYVLAATFLVAGPAHPLGCDPLKDSVDSALCPGLGFGKVSVVFRRK